MKNDYYKAYDKRYRQTYENNSLWEIQERTKEIIDTLKKYKITKKSNILELGCGEGRDAIYLLDNGYNVLGVDYSFAVIDKCNELTNYKYVNNFKQLDLIENSLNEKFDFIYSVAVIHMFVLDEHRNKFYNFIYDHLKDNGIALIISMGDGILEINSDLEKAFDDTKRVNINTNKEIMRVIQEALDSIRDFPKDVLTQVFSRDDVKIMLSLDKYIDLIIPRGGNNLVRFIKENTKIPVLGHADGICHIFVDESADLEKAKRVIIDAKTQYPSACNAVETLLIHKDFKYTTELLKALEEAGVELIAKPERVL